MPNLDFFCHLGVYVEKDFLNPSECDTLRKEIRASLLVPADVIDADSSNGRIDERVRRVREAHVNSPTVEAVIDKLALLTPTVASFFSVPLTGIEEPQFLLYQGDDFFLAHQDRDDYPGKDGKVTQRRISTVVFLNNCASNPDEHTYSGGSLTLYGLLSGPQWAGCGFPLVGDEGTLVAFSSDIVHEVKPVLSGQRFTIVTWYI